MCNTGAGVHKGIDLTRIHMDTMRSDNLRFEQALFLHVRNDRNAILIAHVLHFESGFGKMRMQWHVKLFGEVSGGTQDFGGAGVGSVWRNGGHNQRDRKSTRLNSSHVAISYA